MGQKIFCFQIFTKLLIVTSHNQIESNNI